jgi:hypothetical protein
MLTYSKREVGGEAMTARGILLSPRVYKAP